MDDLIAWLLAAIDEDEAAARTASRPGAPWVVAGERPKRWGDLDPDPILLGGGKIVARFNAEYGGVFNAAHAERWDPARALAECQAKRRVIALHANLSVGDYSWCGLCSDTEGGSFMRYEDWPCPTMRAIALPYVGRPGYQESWRP